MVVVENRGGGDGSGGGGGKGKRKKEKGKESQRPLVAFVFTSFCVEERS